MTVDTIVKRNLTPKQERFALLLFQGLSQREAYIQAGYSARMTVSSMDELACRFANSVQIMSRTAELRSKAESAAIGTVQERQTILTAIYRAKIAEFVDESGNLDVRDKSKLDTPAVRELKTERTSRGGIRTTLKLGDPVAAIMEHNRMERIGGAETVINFNEIRIIVEREARTIDIKCGTDATE